MGEGISVLELPFNGFQGLQCPGKAFRDTLLS